MDRIILALAEASTSTDTGPINGDDILKKLIPTFWPFITQLIAFLILVVAVMFLAYKPVKNLLKKRNEFVEANINESSAKLLEAENKDKQADQNILDSRVEANKIIEAAKLDAETRKEEIIESAKKDANKEIEKAKEIIAMEVEKSKDEIHKEIVSVALDASSKILEREVSDKDNEKLVDNFIKEIEEK